MRGSITKIVGGGDALERYLNDCNQVGEAFERYLGGPSEGIRFERFMNGRSVEARALQKGGLTMLLEGRDPTSGDMLKKFKAIQAGAQLQVRAYEIPINDSKELNTAGVAFEDVHEAHAAAQEAGVAAVKEYLADHVTVRLRDGQGGRVWKRPDEIMFASATHHTSRDGDPQLHQHLELVNRARVDGKWYAIDSVKLFGMYENIRSVYETTVYGDPRLVETLRAHGMSLDMDGRIPELGEAADVFSKRGHAIQERYAQLVGQWKEKHAGGPEWACDPETGEQVARVGYEGGEIPDRVLIRLKTQAWAETRHTKDEHNTRVDWDAWNGELKASGYDLHAMLDGKTGDPRAKAAPLDTETAERCALNAVNELSGMRSAWSVQDLEVAAYKQIRRLNVTGTRAELESMADGIAGKAAGLCVRLSDDPRADKPWIRCMTSNAVIECEDDLKGRLAVRGIEQSGNLDLKDIAAEYTLDGGQREAAETICKGDPLAVVEGAAGAGKTHMLDAVKRFCDVTGCGLMIATPTQKAAITARDEVGTDACTVMKLLEAYGWRHDENDPEHPWIRVREGETDFRGNVYHGVPEEYRMDSSTRLVVDEAGMIDQEQARALLHVADETGAKLTLVGDTSQLSSVGRGGVLELAKRYTGNVVEMTDIHRFKDHGYAEFSLRLRAREAGDVEPLAREIVDRGMVRTAETDGETVAAIADAWTPETVISTGTNEQATMVNKAIQERLMNDGRLGSRSVTGMVPGESIREGDLVMCRRNDRNSGVANRQTFTVDAIHADGSLTVSDHEGSHELDAAYVRRSVQLGYASTTYGVQGVTAERAIFYASPGATGADAYVALTRGKASNQVFMAAADMDDAAETLESIIGRDRGDSGLDAARQNLQAQIDMMTPEIDPDKLERLEDLMSGFLEDVEGASAAWDRYRDADRKVRELSRESEARNDRSRSITDEMRHIEETMDDARARLPEARDSYEAALRDDPMYKNLLQHVTNDASRVRGMENFVTELRDELARFDSRPAILRRIGRADRESLAKELNQSERYLDSTYSRWQSDWGASPEDVHDPERLEEIARGSAETLISPTGRAGRLATVVAGLERDLADGENRLTELWEESKHIAASYPDLSDRQAYAVRSMRRAWNEVPEWFRDPEERSKLKTLAVGARDALGVPDDAERYRRMNDLYRSDAGHDFGENPTTPESEDTAVDVQPSVPEPEFDMTEPDLDMGMDMGMGAPMMWSPPSYYSGPDLGL